MATNTPGHKNGDWFPASCETTVAPPSDCKQLQAVQEVMLKRLQPKGLAALPALRPDRLKPTRTTKKAWLPEVPLLKGCVYMVESPRSVIYRLDDLLLRVSF